MEGKGIGEEREGREEREEKRDLAPIKKSWRRHCMNGLARQSSHTLVMRQN